MIYAIGDIHGEADALRQMLAKLPVQPTDLVIFLGDAINRGPDPFDCIVQIIAFDRCAKIFIQGNHEEAMLLFLEEGDIATLAGLNGQTTLDSYARAGYALLPGDLQSFPLDHLRLYAQIHSWTLPFTSPTNIFSHTQGGTWPCLCKCSLQAHCAGARSKGKSGLSGHKLSCAGTRRSPKSCSRTASSTSA